MRDTYLYTLTAYLEDPQNDMDLLESFDMLLNPGKYSNAANESKSMIKF